eukprot:7060769-Pyramimonas_sp.AAC.1
MAPKGKPVADARGRRQPRARVPAAAAKPRAKAKPKAVILPKAVPRRVRELEERNEVLKAELRATKISLRQRD